MPKHQQRIVYALFTVLSFFLVGVGIVLPSWVSFHIGGSQLVGFTLISSSLAGLVLAPLAGYIVDKYDRKAMSAVGQATRAAAMLLVGLADGSSAFWGGVLLVVASVFGAFGFAILSGSLGGLLQRIVPADERTSFSLRMSVAKQIGIGCGTGAAGIALHFLENGGAGYLFGAFSFACIGLLHALPSSPPLSTRSTENGLFSSNMEALRYVLRRPECLASVLFTGLSFSIIQVTNVLLPGFVVNSLNGDSSLFGVLEMAAALAGAASALLVSRNSLAESLRRRMTSILIVSALSLIAFSFSQTPAVAVITYCVSGTLWSVSRALTNANFLIVIDNEMIGRAQGFSTLLTGAFGGAIYLAPIILPGASEHDLYIGCGIIIILCVSVVSFLESRTAKL